MTSLVVHAGAGRHHAPPEEREAAVEAAAAAGMAAAGGGSLAMAVAAVTALEECGLFDAGAGSVRQADGRVRVDASVMTAGPEGHRRLAAVVALPGAWPAAAVVAALLEERHPMRAGTEAARWASQAGFAPLRPSVEPYRRWRRRAAGPAGTVGAVAHDGESWAALTSTGGRAGAPPGRVGDSPLVGCGTLADARGAAVATGIGEAIARARLAERALRHSEEADAGAAASLALADLEADPLGEGKGGLLLLTAAGEAGWAANTVDFPVASHP